MQIETLYRCRIDYMRTGDDSKGFDDVTNRAIVLARAEPKVEIEVFDGCPACHPYIQMESENLAAVKRLAGKVERYIKRRSIFELVEE
ncbi:hypothetical protein SAMN04487867_104117 [Vreelandella titanicae]|uniref:hypothetical protein n=1 Tax=Vreelandella titanicae TaxID=664683 RepID=UPI000885A6F8|nr:hypothetical protein [Halomonas titanicae]SDI28983.1 hypothetical protein SAMN04487867_104117 [Halomonas titanicae]